MIAGANVWTMERLKCTFMGTSFASAIMLRRSLLGDLTFLPHVISERGSPALISQYQIPNFPFTNNTA